MKTWKIFWGLGFILSAVLLILDTAGIISPLMSFMGEVSVFAVILGLLLLAFLISRLIEGRIASVFFPLAFLFMLFEKNVAYMAGLENEDIINNWLVLLIALLLFLGTSILFPHSNGKKSHFFHRNHKGTVEYSGKYAENNLCSSSIYVDCVEFSPAHIENNLGSCSVHFENAEQYKGGATLYVENNLGSMCINVPSGWLIKSTLENNLGGSHIPSVDNANDCGPILYIKGENNLGSITVQYI